MHSKIRGISPRLSVIMAIILTAILIDTLAFRISVFYREQYLLTIIFIIVSVVISLGQLVILLFIRDKSKAQAIGHHLGLLQRLVPVVQFALVAIVVSVILQLILTTYYSTVLLISALAISYTTSLVIMGLLAQKFVSWFKSNRRWIVLLYGISFAILFVDIVVTLSLTINLLLNAPMHIWPHYGIVSPQGFSRGSLTEILSQAYVIFSIMSFAAMWLTTALLLYSYSLRLGRLRYWIFICSPLVFFLSQFVTVLLNVFTPLIESDPVFFSIFFTMIFSLTKPAGGILFGVAFWAIARNIPNRTIIRDRIVVSAWGFVLLFISSQANTLFSNPYPPFGLATVPILSLSSYLLLLGIYSSAIMISEDAKLRRDIRKSVLNDSRLLESISKAQLEQEMQNRVTAIMKKNKVDNIVKEEPVTESFPDARHYIDEIMDEFLTKKDKTKKEGEEPT
ncbi:MAG TPA: hypothetical protein VKA09_06535 [Nitrososphaeraceae archaeon]|nr:hypothetical protein [Nitrososphaeraceae archaeon]